MARVGFTMKLFPESEEEYEKRHDELWPELESLLKDSGIREYSIFLDRRTGTLFACLQTDEPEKLANLPDSPVMKKWWAYMKDLMETNSDGSPVTFALKEVFYLP
jgi:L-rhamnose mutarotase